MRVAVITIAAGRPRHLERQSAALARLASEDHGHHVVAMGDDAERARCAAVCAPGTDVIAVAREPGGLPLARARNAGARRALDAGAELLVFLDVDCLPASKLLARYRAAAGAVSGALLCGPVGYLPPVAAEAPASDEELAALARPHPARPVPPDHMLWHGGDHRLFWTLSFAVTDTVWSAVGGFCEDYVGYGGEDTDFGQRARAAGIDVCWVGGAWAYHQHHPTHDPPVQHRDAIERNAALFSRRWGWRPMEGWLDAFAAADEQHEV